MQTTNSDDAELMDAINEADAAQEHVEDQAAAEQQAMETSAQIGKQYSPGEVPWINDQYTWADRQLELELLSNLLSTRLSDVRAELKFVRDVNASRAYPNIAFNSDTRKE
jgi:hydroxylamine reductase (hybrid-cluster protein)